MKVTYRSYHVITKPRLNLDADCWVPVADVSWDEQGNPHHQLLSGMCDRFKSIEDAELEAFELAMNWIDAQFPIPDTAKLVA
jgi:hypothetical protein